MTALAHGFANPVLDCQCYYRAVLDAMSRPARPVPLPALPPIPVPGGAFGSGMAALALTLCDGETPLWLQPELRTEALHTYLRFHCGAPLTEDPARAAFAFIASPLTMPPLSAFAQGSALCPEQSATLVLAVRLKGPADFSAAGPGIGGPDTGGTGVRPLACKGLPQTFAEQWQANHQAYPQGVDVLLLDDNLSGNGASMAGLPRTTRISTMPQAPEA